MAIEAVWVSTNTTSTVYGMKELKRISEAVQARWQGLTSMYKFLAKGTYFHRSGEFLIAYTSLFTWDSCFIFNKIASCDGVVMLDPDVPDFVRALSTFASVHLHTRVSRQ